MIREVKRLTQDHTAYKEHNQDEIRSWPLNRGSFRVQMLPLGVPWQWLLCLGGSQSQPWAHGAAAFCLTGPPTWVGDSHQVARTEELCLDILPSAKVSELSWELAFSLFEKKKNPKTMSSVCLCCLSLNTHTSTKGVVHELAILWRAQFQVWRKTTNWRLTLTILKEWHLWTQSEKEFITILSFWTATSKKPE